MAGATGLEPATSAVTGQRSNQLSYAPAGVDSSYRRPQPKSRRTGVNCGKLRKSLIFREELMVRPPPNRLCGQSVWRSAKLTDSRGGSTDGYNSWKSSDTGNRHV